MLETHSPLTPELCRTFVLLARFDGSVKATARELGLNVASISKRIRPLLFGMPPHLPRPWLAKRGKRFELTEEGRTMLPAAIEQAERWGQFTSFASAVRLPGITVACGQESAGGIVLEAARRFRRQHPLVNLRIAVVRGRRRIEGIASGAYDLALVTHTPPAIRDIARREVQIDVLSDDELVLACAATSEWAGTFTRADKSIKREELMQWPLVLPETDSPIRKQWDERIRRSQTAAMPQVAIEVGGWRVLLGYVLAGFGVGLLPRSLAEQARDRLHWRPLIETLRPVNRVYAVRPILPTNLLADAFFNTLAPGRR
ncbi:MAG TPA: LysR family transcriptional regulator [Gemmataceae bacterium]|nr:LysR family transcriptional regulator [Gemmataceae bacterium]